MSEFLDDKLYNHTVNRKYAKTGDVQELVNELFRICEDHWKPQADMSRGPGALKILLHKTFNSWDLFVAELGKSDRYKVLASLLKTNSYKAVFMNDLKARLLYDKL